MRWRRVVAVPIVLHALAATPLARAADVPDGTAGAPVAPPPAAEASATSWWVPGVPALLRDLGIESWLDVVKLQPWSGSIGFTFDQQEQRVTAPESPKQVFGSRLLTETFAIRNDGFSVVDPRFFTGTIGVGFSLQQGWQNALGVETKDHANVVGYAFDGTFLPESPYNLNLFATRAQNTYVQPSGSTTRNDIRNQGVTLRLRETSILRDLEILPYFSANLRVYQQYDKQTTTLGGQTFRQDDRRDILAFDFQNGTETSDLAFQYQYTRLANYAYTDGSYDAQSANLVYSIDFGPTLNCRSDTRANYYSRSGVSSLYDLSTLDLSEFVTVDHNVDLSTSYSYQLTRQAAEFGTATTQGAGIQASYQIFRNLSASGTLVGAHSSLPGGTVSNAGIAGSLSYSRTVPWSGQLTANGGAGYAVTSTEVPAGVVPVVDAPYAVPQNVGAGATILLRDRNIVTQSIVVVVLKNGARVTATSGVDYTVQVDGDRTSLVPLPTSALMQPGDPLLVSYVYQIASDAKYKTVSGSFSFGIDWPWIGVNYGHDQTDQSPLSGRAVDPLLLSERRDGGFVYLRGLWENLQARVTAGLTRYNSPRLDYVEQRLDQILSWQPWETLQLNVAASEVRTDYQRPTHETRTTSARFDAQWNWGPWQTSLYAGWRSYRDTQQPSETIEEAGVRVRRTWTMLDFSLYTAVQQRTRGNVTSLNGVVHVGLARRF